MGFESVTTLALHCPAHCEGLPCHCRSVHVLQEILSHSLLPGKLPEPSNLKTPADRVSPGRMGTGEHLTVPGDTPHVALLVWQGYGLFVHDVREVMGGAAKPLVHLPVTHIVSLPVSPF